MFFKNIHIRMKIILVITFLLFFIIIGRVMYIQVIDYNKLNKNVSGENVICSL